MTEDEKLAERCLERRLHLSAGQARDLAEKDFYWIKSKGAQLAAGSGESGSHSESSAATVTPFKVTEEQAARLLPRLDPKELYRMSES